MTEDEFVFYEFSRSKVERGDFSHFLNLYGLDKLPSGRPLRAMMNCFVFHISGYDQDHREIHSIPEVRRSYSAFHDAWPYWIFFCNLDTENLKMMTFCCLPTLTALKVDGQAQAAVTYDALSLLSFLKRDFLPMNMLCERAEMFEDRIFNRSKQVFDYFGMPLDPGDAS